MQLIWEYGDILSVLDEDNLVFVPARYLARCETTPNKSWVAVWYPGEPPCLELRCTTELDMGREYDFRHETGRHEGASDAPRLSFLLGELCSLRAQRVSGPPCTYPHSSQVTWGRGSGWVRAAVGASLTWQ